MDREEFANLIRQLEDYRIAGAWYSGKLSLVHIKIRSNYRYRLVVTGPARSTVKSQRVSTFLPFTFAVKITVYIFGSNF